MSAPTTPGFELWGVSTVEDSAGRRGTLYYGKDDDGKRESYILWRFEPADGAPAEDMFVQLMWAGEAKHEKRPSAKSPWNSMRTIGGRVFSYRRPS